MSMRSKRASPLHLNATVSTSQAAPEPETVPVCRPYMPSAAAISPYLGRIDDARWYSNYGPLVGEFEARLAQRLDDGARVTTLTSATTAIALALKAMNAPQDSLCILPSWTFVATAHAVMQAGLVPWFHDVDSETWMLDPVAVEAQLVAAPGPVGAIVPVAAFGLMPDTATWAALGRRWSLPVVLDAAAAFDTLRDAEVPAAVSLHATKALGVGEGGYLAARDPKLLASVHELANFGFVGSRIARRPATNGKLSEYAAAVGLASLDQWVGTRERYLRVAQQMRIACSALPQIVFQPGWGLNWVSSVCTIRTPSGQASRIAARMELLGVDSRAWWGEGCHRSPAFADAPRTALPVTDHLAQSTLGLPFAADMSTDQIRRLADALGQALT